MKFVLLFRCFDSRHLDFSDFHFLFFVENLVVAVVVVLDVVDCRNSSLF